VCSSRAASPRPDEPLGGRLIYRISTVPLLVAPYGWQGGVVPQRRSAVVTGGATGIGLASAVALAGAGFDITLVGRRPDALRSAATTLGASGVAVKTYIADMGDPDAPSHAVDAHVDRFGGVDAFVAAAGAWDSTSITDMTAAAWDATLNVHVRGAVLGAGAAARHMIAARHGRIVLVSSVNGYQSEPDTSAYSAAKTAVISVVRSLAVELADTGVTANAVAPGWVATPMTAADLAAATPEALRRLNPQARFGHADEIAEVIRWLAIDAPAFLTGSTIIVDGGQTAQAPLP
jgi:3-oxoacyl-[acyl-carrier protein] reductase